MFLQKKNLEYDEESQRQMDPPQLYGDNLDQEDQNPQEIFNFDDIDSGDDRVEEEIQNQQTVQRVPAARDQMSEINKQKQFGRKDSNDEIIDFQSEKPKGGILANYMKSKVVKTGEQYEPGQHYDDDADSLPKLDKHNHEIKFKEVVPTGTQRSNMDSAKQSNAVIMKHQRVQLPKPQEELDYKDSDRQSEVDFMKYQESNRNEPQIVDEGNLECEQSFGEKERDDIEVVEVVEFNQPGQLQKPPTNQGFNDQDIVEIIHNPPSSESSPSGKWPFPPKFNLDNFPTTSAMMRNFLTSPLPPGQTLQCFIKRSKSGLARLYPVYHMYTTEGARYMLTAKKVVMNSTSNYILCMQRDNLSTKSENYLGKVKSNFMGTEFMLYDNGMNPKHTKNTMVIRNQLGVIHYESNLMSNKGPRRMRIVVPKVSTETCLPKQFMPLNSKEGIQQDFKYGKHEYLDIFQNKPPRWNEQIQAYVLNFYGRVDKPSVKNFQLIRPQTPDTMHFQFGRVDDLNFNLDFTWPFSPLQAMQICVSSFDFKFACE